jgi:hypothetical protein
MTIGYDNIKAMITTAKKNVMKKLLPIAGILLMGALMLSACKKDYYVDGGLANPIYKGTIYDYLKNNPLLLDTIAYIVERAGLKETLQNDSVTFFSPTDDAIKMAMDNLNEYRYFNVEDSVFIDDINPAIWRQFLSMYIMDGRHFAKDFARVDPNNIYAYPGINYVMKSGYIFNIGLIYENYNGVEAVGARIMRITDITFDPTNFNNNPSSRVATTDIQPTNGVLHVLNIRHIFGFRPDAFFTMAENDLINR